MRRGRSPSSSPTRGGRPRPSSRSSALGFHVVVTHGNGPQVGAALLRSERAADQVYTHPLDVCDATTQGEIGYLLQQSLHGGTGRGGADHARGDGADAGAWCRRTTRRWSSRPSPSARSTRRARREARRQQFGWTIVEDAAPRVPPRRAVARAARDRRGGRDPAPDRHRRARHRRGRRRHPGGARGAAALRGVEAVIDKDRASALLASRLAVDLLRHLDRRRTRLPGLQEARPAPAGPRDGRRDRERTTPTGSSRPATWGRRSSRRCGSCATAASEVIITSSRAPARRGARRRGHAHRRGLGRFGVRASGTGRITAFGTGAP